MDAEHARQNYQLQQKESLFATHLDRQIAETGIATIAMPISEADFQEVLGDYETCIGECPDQLAATLHKVDKRFGSEAGHIRKERKIHPTTGVQLQDPKNIMHFNEHASAHWQSVFRVAPAVLKTFLSKGEELHHSLIAIARHQFTELEETHPNISHAYFPNIGIGPQSHSYMRLLSYDGYAPSEDLGDVAKPHFDIGGATIQAYADAPGFWGAKNGLNGQRIHYDTRDDEAYMFMGYGHKKLYGKEARLMPLWHGVDRITPPGANWITKRHAVILFIDAPLIDYQVTAEDTLPYVSEAPSDQIQQVA